MASLSIHNATITGPSSPSGAPVAGTSTPVDVSAAAGTARITAALTPASSWQPSLELHLETAEDSAGSTGWREVGFLRLNVREGMSRRVGVGGLDKFVRARWVFNGAPSATLAITGETNSELVAGAVGTSVLADESVTAGKLAADAVETAKILDDAVTGPKIADGSIAAAHVANAAAGVGALVAIHLPFTAGVGGSADDVTLFDAAWPFKARIVDVFAVIATAVEAKTAQLRDTAGGAGSALSDAFDAGSTGVKRNAAITATSTIDADASLFLRRSDSGLAGEVVILAQRIA
ncbi:MAG: hypothetical protein HYV09_35775 [Deltaproteobacteria bacterium]|nr:hypothetical protein [Deltaproteobacteria bacterium]